MGEKHQKKNVNSDSDEIAGNCETRDWDFEQKKNGNG